MARPVNPYVAGNPVGNSPAFVGRADVLREVLGVLRRPQDNAIVLYGQRRIGKTSILQHLAAVLPQEGPYRAVYFDLQDKAAWPLGRVLQNLARTIANALGRPDPDLGSDAETAFRQEWLPAILGDLPEGCSLVLLFDEFDVLADPQAEQAAAAFFPYLRDLLASDPQRLQFVFVIGRNVDDLTNIALSLFKGTPARRVSLLSRKDTADLVRLSEANGTLRWPDKAAERVWQLTCGHPFLTQQLCSHVWEQAYDEEPDALPTVTLEGVDAAVSDALGASRNTLEWLWDGLPPAERVVVSALAEAGPGSITQEGLERLLHESGVRVVIRELQNAPRLLQDWDLIEPSDGGYRFRVELLRRWITGNKPLSRVQEELDRIEPVAENLYRAALGLYQGGQLDQAVAELRQAVVLNPNHVRANLLLADILLAQGQPGEAQQLLERVYEYQPANARPRLVQLLLTQAQVAESDDQRLALYEHVLSELDATQPEALTGKRQILQQRGDAALERDDFEAALEAYRKAGLNSKVAEVEQAMRRQVLATRLQELEVLGQERRYHDALDLAHKLAKEYPGMQDWNRIEQDLRQCELDVRLQEVGALEQERHCQAALDLARQLSSEYPQMRDWTSDLQRLERKTQLADLYQHALEALRSDDRQTATNLLVQVVALEPGYEEATRYLHLAVTGMDVVELQKGLGTEIEARRKAETRAKSRANARRQREQELKRLQDELENEKKARQEAEAKANTEAKARRRREQELKRLQTELETERRARDQAESVAQKYADFHRQLERGSEGLQVQTGTGGKASDVVMPFATHLPTEQEWDPFAGVDFRPEEDKVVETVIAPASLSTGPVGPVGQRPLSLWNPLDYLRLLWWVLVTPQRLRAYREVVGKDKDERRLGKWLASTSIWLLFFIPALAMGLGLLPRGETIHLPTGLIGVGLIFGWVLTSWLLGMDRGLTGVAAVVAAIAVVWGVAGGTAGGIASVVSSVVVGVAVFVLVGAIACGVIVLVAGGVGGIVGRVKGSDAGWDVFATIFSIMFLVLFVGALVMAFVVAGIGGGLLALGIGVVMGVAANSMEESLRSGHPSWLVRATSGVLVLAYGFLIWFSFLGGWAFDWRSSSTPVEEPTGMPEVVTTTLTPTDSPSQAPSPLPAPETAPPLGTVRFSDDFDHGQTQLYWSSAGYGTVRAVHDQLEVRAELWEGTSRSWKTIVTGGPDTRESYICDECAIQVGVQIPGADIPRGAGIAFGYSSSTDFYQFVVLGSDGSYDTWAVVKGSPSSPYLAFVQRPTPWTVLSPVSSTFTLRVDLRTQEQPDIVRGIAYCYVNNVKVGVVELPDYTGGRVGVVTVAPPSKDGLAWFDDFLVAK